MALLTSAFSVPASGEVSLEGFGLVRSLTVEAPQSYRDGGFGRNEFGARDAEQFSLGLARIGVVAEWSTLAGWKARLSVVGQGSTESYGDQDLGITELFLEKEWGFSHGQTTVRVGHFILPTSRENVAPGWTSPYTLSFSAINTWIGEDVRPTGVLLKSGFGERSQFELGVTAFGGNDTSGTLLAWRGWSLSDRIVGYSEAVPLPPLSTLADPTIFGEQRDDGSQPFGADLDGRVGWAGFATWRPTTTFSLRATRYNNRGDKQLHRGEEYAWATDFELVGADLHLRRWDVLAEWMDGHTGMGNLQAAHVRARFEAFYGLISWHTANTGEQPRLRVSLRFDKFSTIDIDGTSAELNDDAGTAWTLAVLWSATRSLRLGIEFQDAHGDRPQAGLEGFERSNGGRQALLELRYRFRLASRSRERL